MKTMIRVKFKAENLTIIERAKKIYDLHLSLSKYLNKYDWLLDIKKPINISDESVNKIMLKSIFRTANSKLGTKIKETDFGIVSSGFSFFADTKYDDSCIVSYRLGAIWKYDKYSLNMFKNFEVLEQLRTFNEITNLIKYLINEFDPYLIEVTDFGMERINDFQSGEIWHGWMTYINNEFEVPKFPDDIEVINYPNDGKLIISTHDFFEIDNPLHLEKAQNIINFMRENNIKIPKRYLSED